MSKKKFIDNLDSLFGFTTEVETFQEENPLLGNEEGNTATLVAPRKTKLALTKPSVKKAPKKRLSKNFHSNLEDLFQEAFEEKMEERMSEEKTGGRRIRKIRPRMGLDSLIRNTQNLAPEQIQVNDDQKRVTFLYSKMQLEKLREISRKDSRFMKDIIGEAVNKWLEKYDKSKEDID